MCTTFFYPSSVYIVCVEYDFSVNTYTPEVHNNKFCDLHMYPNCYLDCWPRSQAFREEREGLVHTVCACVNFMNAHVLKYCGRVYGNSLKLTHAVSETEYYARVYESDI